MDKKALVDITGDRSALDVTVLPNLGMEKLVKNLSEIEPKYVAVAGYITLLSMLTVATTSPNE